MSLRQRQEVQALLRRRGSAALSGTERRESPLRASVGKELVETLDAGRSDDERLQLVRVARLQPDPGGVVVVGPRAVMTAAHVISSNNNVVVTAAAAGKRGTSWNGDDEDWGPGTNYHSSSKFPFGARRVVWYYWNTGYDGHPRYDYGALILQDLAWSPGWIRAGHQSTSWLDFRDGWYMFGYPGGSCANGFDGDGTCGGYMYRIKGETRDVHLNYAIHWLDTTPGQSGSLLYYLKNNDRVAYLINHGSCDGVRDCGVAKKLRSGSYNSICSIVNSYPSSHFSQSDCD